MASQYTESYESVGRRTVFQQLYIVVYNSGFTQVRAKDISPVLNGGM